MVTRYESADVRSTRFASESSTQGALIMRTLATLSLSLLLFLGVVMIAHATPITGGTGPGGNGTTDGTSSLNLWLHTGTISQSNGSTVIGWTDSSGSGNSATTAGTNPSFLTPALNGYGAVSFTSTQVLNIPAFDLTNMSIFGVARASGDRHLLQHSSNFQARMRQVGAAVLSAYNGDNPMSTTITTATSGYFIAEWLSAGASNTISFFESGAARGSGTFTGGNPTGFDRVGQTTGSGATLDVVEIAVFNERVSSTRRTIIENALRSKYALPTLSGALDVYAGDVAGYSSDVFGIGNDGTGAFTNAGQAGLGIEVTDGSLDANDWVLAGNDGTANSIVAFSTGSDTVGDRWSREWYVDVSGDGANATLGFDFDDAGVGGSFNISDVFKLLYRPNSSSDWQVLALTGVASGGGLVTFAVPSNVLVDGLYTLGINVTTLPEPSTLALFGLGAIGLATTRRRRPRR